MNKYFALAVVLLATSTPPAAAPAPAVMADPSQSAPVQQIALGNRAFGVDLYRNLAATEPGNIFISPISLAGAFGPLTAGAQGETRADIGRVLRFPTDDSALHPELGGLLRTLESNRKGARVSIANALWVARDFPVKPAFLQTGRRHYRAEVANLDFRNSEAAARRINQWVERETAKRIRDLVSPRALGSATRLVVTNAVHFLGDWAVAFDPAFTKPEPFYAAAGVRQVPLMFAGRSVRYAEADGVKMIDLPYKGDRLSMSVILPKQRGALGAVEAGLSDARLGQWLGQLDAAHPRAVQIHLPKVQIESSYGLGVPLTALGMGVAFDPQRANFRGIADADLVISQVVQKTFLRVDEKGTEAAAATAIIVQVTSAPSEPPPTFRADHPFLLLIRDKPTGAVLFLGRISAP
jgi:serpin B